MLSIKELDCFYGDLQILWDVSLEVEEKTITAIIGSNGAGKTTLLNSIVGLKRVKSGAISWGARGSIICALTRLQPWESLWSLKDDGSLQI